MVTRIDAHLAARGFTLWAVEIPEEVPFAGFVGLVVPKFDAHFTPCVEIGWRLAREHWGKVTQSRRQRWLYELPSAPWGFTRSCRSRCPPTTAPGA
jgi:hypothetical protein